MALLEVKDLTVSFPMHDGPVQAVRGVSFSLNAGETLGIIGESGSGKTALSLALLGLSNGSVNGSIEFDGHNLLTASPSELRAIRGAGIAMVFQDALSALHPLYRVGWQIVEMIQAHTKTSRAEARQQAIDLLRAVSIPEPERRIHAYPHELSGGMRQRVMIAMALSLRPKVLIADEPTSALDATVQAQIIQLLGRLRNQMDMALIMITHDLGVVARTADSVLVMYAGKIVEVADRATIFKGAHHPYTCALLTSVPSSGAARVRLTPIRGSPPSLVHVPNGCAFHPRCDYAMKVCRTDIPPLGDVAGGQGHLSACWLPGATTGISADAREARAAFAREAEAAE